MKYVCKFYQSFYYCTCLSKLCVLFRYNNYAQHGIKKNSYNSQTDARSLFSKRIGGYVSSHGYAEAQAKQLLHNAALTGNGLVWIFLLLIQCKVFLNPVLKAGNILN